MRTMLIVMTILAALASGGMYQEGSTATEVLDRPIAVQEPAAEREIAAELAEAEALETETEAEAEPVAQVANAVVDVDAWSETFEELWNASHDESLHFEVSEPEEDDAYPTLRMLDIGDGAVYMQLYYSRDAEIYWFVVTISEENTPVRKQEQYEAYFFDAISTALLSHYDELSVRELKDIDTRSRSIVRDLQAGTMDPEEAYFYYYDTFATFEYDEEMGLFECYIGF